MRKISASFRKNYMAEKVLGIAFVCLIMVLVVSAVWIASTGNLSYANMIVIYLVFGNILLTNRKVNHIERKYDLIIAMLNDLNAVKKQTVNNSKQDSFE